MKLFITGSEGFVGKALVAQCEKQNIDYLAVDIIDKKSPKYVRADTRSNEISDLIPEGVDAIVHLAGLTRDPDCKNKGYECFNANVMVTLNLIEAAQKKNVKQFVFASTEWVYGPFQEGEIKNEETVIDIAKLTSEYALSKLVSESNLRQKYQHGFCPVTVLRFGIIYGPRPGNWSAVESLFNEVKNKDTVSIGCGKTGRCFIHVDDIVAGIISSIGLSGFNVVNLEGDQLITLADVIVEAGRILGKKPVVVEKDPTNSNVRNVSNARSKQLLGWKQRMNLEAGLRSLL